MPSAKKLRVRCAFGRSLKETMLLAAHPDEMLNARGKPLPDARTLVLGLQGDRAVFREELPLPLVRCWYANSGTAYCGSLERSSLHVFRAGKWSEEVFSDTPIDIARYVYAFPGKTAGDDIVFVGASKRLFVRQAGKWQSKRLSGEGFPYQMEGGKADEIYIGGVDLFLWDGKKLSELESPSDDTMRGLAITADDRLIGGNTYVSVSTPDGSWQRIDTKMQGFFGFARLGNDVYALSDEDGVVRLYPGKPKVVTRAIDPFGFVAVGDGLIAIGKNEVLAFDGKKWFDITLPKCEQGKTP